MKPYLLYVPVVLLASVSLAQTPAQQPGGGTDQEKPATIRATGQEVILDMVFRDKKGKTVRDIRPDEIHVTEDGVEQKLGSLRLLEGTKARPVTSDGSGAAAPMPLDPMREVRLVTLVFENLDQEGKRFFRQAVKDILDMSPEPNLFFSVLTVDQTLHVLQPFTSNHELITKSLERAAMWSFIQYSQQSAEVKQSLERTLSQDPPTLSGSRASGGPSSQQVGDMVSYELAKIQHDMLDRAEAAQREYGARATISALTELIRAQSQLPGRKVVLYFNPWLIIPESIKEQYASVKSAANRANISFYTVDTKGLVTWSQNSGGNNALNEATRDSRSMQTRGAGEVNVGQVRAVERGEDAQRQNPLLWLRDLAESTGGTAIAETNDWKAPLKIAMDEVRTYYEAAYTPQISKFDGSFRKIAVRVDRPGVTVHTRNGYFAIPSLKGGQQLLAYEMPLLNALSASTPPSDVDFKAAAHRFNDHSAKVEYMVSVEAPLSAVTFAPQPEKKVATMDADLLCVIRDDKGEIVDKFSKDFAVQVDLDKLDAYKAGNLLQTFRTELAAGHYSLETVVMDKNSKRTGVKKTSITVPPPSQKLSLSDVVIIRRTDALKDTKILDAFYFPGGKVVPTLRDTLKGGPGNVLPFYFTVYTDPEVKDSPKLTMSFYKDGQFLGAAEAPLPAAQKDGRIPYIANLPADRFVPGNYEVKLSVMQASAKAEQAIAFHVN